MASMVSLVTDRSVATVSFGRWVEREFGKRGYSQRKFAAAIGISHSAISLWIKNGSAPDQVATLYKIAEVLDLPAPEVFQRAGRSLESEHPVSDPSPSSTEAPGILLFGGGEHLTPEQKDELARRLQKTIDDYLADNRKN